MEKMPGRKLFPTQLALIMKKNQLMSTLKKYISIASLVIVMVSLNSCKTKIDFLTSAVVPAAKGYVTVERDNNKNYKIYLNVSNFAESTRLTPSKATYVVWVVGGNNNVRNIGQIQTSNLSASLETVSSFKPSKIFITAEDAGNVQYPGDTILTTPSF